MAFNALTAAFGRERTGNILTDSLLPQRAIAGKLIFFSMITNLAALAMSLFMMQIFDRVLSSQSKDTLFFLVLAVTMVITTSLRAASSAGVAHSGTPSATSAAADVGRRAHTARSCPAARRWRAIGSPITPSPMNPTFIPLSFIRPRRRSCARAASASQSNRPRPGRSPPWH